MVGAAECIRGVVRSTPMRYSETVSRMAGFEVRFKLENQQKTGSFKLRGAANRIMGGTKSKEVIAASAGNHAQGVAFAAQQAGLRSTIVMPEGAPLTKAEATRSYGATVIQQGNSYDDCYQLALEMAEAQGMEYIHAFDDPRIIAGQGTIGLEILEQFPEVEQVIIPVGGGGLAAGIALAVKSKKPGVRIVGVKAAGADAVVRTLKRGQLSFSEHVSTIADGIAVKRPGQLTTSMLMDLLDNMIVVGEEEIASAMLVALERVKTVVEGAGAVGLAAVMYHKEKLHNGPTAVVISGGNVDVNMVARLIERGLVKTGRLARLQIRVPDRPGSLQRVLSTVSGNGANIISIDHDRLKQDLPLQWTQLTLSVEIRNSQHLEQIVQSLQGQNLSTKIV